MDQQDPSSPGRHVDGGVSTFVDGDHPALPRHWWDDVLRTDPDPDRGVVVRDPSGNRFVLLRESRYEALRAVERAAGTGGRRGAITLTARERDVLQLIAEGCPGSVVAERFGLAANTVAQHLASVRRKYGVRSSAAAAAAARADGLID